MASVDMSSILSEMERNLLRVTADLSQERAAHTATKLQLNEYINRQGIPGAQHVPPFVFPQEYPVPREGLAPYETNRKLSYGPVSTAYPSTVQDRNSSINLKKRSLGAGGGVQLQHVPGSTSQNSDSLKKGAKQSLDISKIQQVPSTVRSSVSNSIEISILI